MQNRLAEINTKAARTDVAVEIDDSAMKEGAYPFMEEFFEEVTQIKALLSLIRKNIKAIQKAYNQQTYSVVDGAQPDSSLEQLLKSTSDAAQQVRTKLKKMDQENKLPEDTAQKRIRTNMHTTLTKKFRDLMTDYQSINTAFKEKSRERIQTQAKIVNPDITTEEVDNIITSGDVNALFVNPIEQKHSEAKSALLFIQQQQKDLRQLEQSISELNQLFLEIAPLLETQGETILQVNTNLVETTHQGSLAVKELQEAEKAVAQRRRRCAGFTTILVVVIVVVVLVVVGLVIAGVMV